MEKLSYPCIKIVGEASVMNVVRSHLAERSREIHDISVNSFSLGWNRHAAQRLSKKFPEVAISVEEAGSERDIRETIYKMGIIVSATCRQDWGYPGDYPPTEWMLTCLRNPCAQWD